MAGARSGGIGAGPRRPRAMALQALLIAYGAAIFHLSPPSTIAINPQGNSLLDSVHHAVDYVAGTQLGQAVLQKCERLTDAGIGQAVVEKCNRVADTTIGQVVQNSYACLSRTSHGQAFLKKCDDLAGTGLGKAMLACYNAVHANPVKIMYKEISESDQKPYPEELFQQYFKAAHEALEMIDKNSPAFLTSVHFVKQCMKTVYNTVVEISHIEAKVPKSGMEAYQIAERIVCEMETLLRGKERLQEIAGRFNDILVVCKIDEKQKKE